MDLAHSFMTQTIQLTFDKRKEKLEIKYIQILLMKYKQQFFNCLFSIPSQFQKQNNDNGLWSLGLTVNFIICTRICQRLCDYLDSNMIKLRSSISSYTLEKFRDMYVIKGKKKRIHQKLMCI